MRYQAVLFDLDGTLIGLDIGEFIPAYFALLEEWLSCRGIDWPVIPRLQRATEAMLQDKDADISNQAVFMREFFSHNGSGQRDRMMQLFDEFYCTRFGELAKLACPIPQAPEVVEQLDRAGCTLVLATNPVFPQTAIRERLQWGDLEPGDFAYITSYENSHLCKPHPGYYREILQQISAQPEEALMVGNDPIEDMAAEKLGIDTFLVEDYMVSRSEPLQPTYSGRLQDVLRLVCDEKVI